MNTTLALRTSVLALCLLAAGAARAGSSVASFVAGDDLAAKPCAEQTALSGLDARIVAIAGQGVAPLRQFIGVTQGIWALDMNNTVAWLDAQRSTLAACVAAATPVTSSVASR
jgi:hypothetical protein